MVAERNWIDLEDDDSLTDALEEARLHGGTVFVHQAGRVVGRLSMLDPEARAETDSATSRRPEPAPSRTPRRWDIARDGDQELEDVRREVARTGEPIQLFFDGHPGAIIVPHQPAPAGPLPPGKTTEDLAALRRAIGSWSDVDADAVIEEIYRLRNEGSRPIAEP